MPPHVFADYMVYSDITTLGWRSDYIIRGMVISTWDSATEFEGETPHSGAISVVRVDEVLKGTLTEEVITVGQSGGWIDPEVPTGYEAVFFLRKVYHGFSKRLNAFDYMTLGPQGKYLVYDNRISPLASWEPAYQYRGMPRDEFLEEVRAAVAVDEPRRTPPDGFRPNISGRWLWPPDNVPGPVVDFAVTPDMASLGWQSEYIIRGRVISVWDSTTNIEGEEPPSGVISAVRVDEVLKGTLAEEVISVGQFGGPFDPAVPVGYEAVFFLRKVNHSYKSPTGPQGRYLIFDNRISPLARVEEVHQYRGILKDEFLEEVRAAVAGDEPQRTPPDGYRWGASGLWLEPSRGVVVDAVFPNLASIAEMSDYVIRGRVRYVWDFTTDIEDDEPPPGIIVGIRVMDVLKGELATKEIITVGQTGGPSDPIVPDGREAFFFLRKVNHAIRENPVYHDYVSVGGPQGQYLIFDNRISPLARVEPVHQYRGMPKHEFLREVRAAIRETE